MRVRALMAVLWLTGCNGFVEEMPTEPDAAVASNDAGAPEGDAGVDAGEVDAGHITIDAGVDAGVAFDAGIDAGLVEVLIAQGRLGRTVISCDDGNTWVNDRDEAMGLRCGDPPDVECFHHAWAPMGLVQAGSAVVATYGWGAPGMIRRTLDGVTWEDVWPGGIFAGVAYGQGRVLAGWRTVITSDADGASGSWSSGGTVMTSGVLRHVTHVPDGAGRFLVVLDDQVQLSDDGGASWRVTPTPSGCASSVLGVLTHERTVVLAQYSGRVCVSTDRGDTWSLVAVTSAFTSRGVYAQGAFNVWNGSTRHRSPDGVTWTASPGTAGVSIGPVVFTAAGTYVAYKGGWQSEYQYERIYRSADGLTWTTLPATAHPHSHPITHLLAAELRPSVVCPAR